MTSSFFFYFLFFIFIFAFLLFCFWACLRLGLVWVLTVCLWLVDNIWHLASWHSAFGTWLYRHLKILHWTWRCDHSVTRFQETLVHVFLRRQGQIQYNTYSSSLLSFIFEDEDWNLTQLLDFTRARSVSCFAFQFHTPPNCLEVQRSKMSGKNPHQDENGGVCERVHYFSFWYLLLFSLGYILSSPKLPKYFNIVVVTKFVSIYLAPPIE